MTMEMVAKTRARAAPMITTPLWSVAVMTDSGGDCGIGGGRAEVSLECESDMMVAGLPSKTL